MWWLFLRPIMPAVGLIYAFGSVRPVDTESAVPYAVFFLSGYLPVRLFQSALRYLPRSLTWSQGLMRRTYFPRLLVPLAGFGTPLIEFAVIVVVFAGRRGHDDVARRAVSAPPRLAHAGGCCRACSPRWRSALAFGLVFSVVALFFRDVIFSLRFFSSLDDAAHAGHLSGDLLARGRTAGRSTRSTRWRRSSS